jgi:hypothetical protein
MLLEETHPTEENEHRLKVKRWKKGFQTFRFMEVYSSINKQEYLYSYLTSKFINVIQHIIKTSGRNPMVLPMQKKRLTKFSILS